jgi:RNA polymerase sigma-70 factor (ECF subfamily)
MARVAAALVGDDAEDAAQEALMRAWRAWPSLRESASTRAWLMQITVNVCRSWRTRGQGLRLNAEDRLDAVAEQQSALDVAIGASEHIDALDLRRCLRDLPEDMRTVIALRFYAGMDSTEIGELLGEPATTVRGRLRRALLRLRELLDRGSATSLPQATPSRKDA